ncbi:MAG: GDP-L-fucose synthase [Methylococcales bacterium]|jgi:GDP-L-fucose synthase|nr:GDP-L-fucose synthase [Methylococcales bacterium]
MPTQTIYIAGHSGLVGSAFLSQLKQQTPAPTLLTKSHRELDLTDQNAVSHFFNHHDINSVILCAARVGGIHANSHYPAEFIYQNLMIECNVIHQAFKAGIKKLLFIASSCSYPKDAPQPIAESSLLTGTLEPTSEPFSVAKIAGIKLCESYNRQYGTDYRTLLPANLYGPRDNFDPKYSHVIPALIHKFHQAKINQTPSVEIWGSGKPHREFLYINDMVEASLYIMGLDQDTYQANTQPMQSHLNIGSNEDISIGKLAELVKSTTGYKGIITFDTSKPDGPMRKALDSSTLQALGWQSKTSFTQGLKQTYQWYLNNQ